MSQEYSDLSELDDPSIELTSRVKSFLAPLIFVLIGLVFVVLGVYLYAPKLMGGQSEGIEVLETTTEGDGRVIVVEVAGAVMSPGVYEVDIDTRVHEVIEKSGGFTDDSDMDWVEKVLNRAAFVEDGQKIVIPYIDEQSTLTSDTENTTDQSISSPQTTGGGGLVNINSATLSELESLWGIGPVIGQKIIDQRPYSSVEELLTKKILKSNVYERNKDLLTVF